MPIYKKLQEVRSELSKTKLTKSGYNKFNNFKYFELSDFLPHISRLCAEKGICSVVNFDVDKAILTLYEDESEQTISIQCATRELKLESKEGKEKMNPLQALGAEQTYLRRYLYMNMFEITENDVLDAGMTQETKEEKPTARDKLVSKMIKGYFTEENVIKVLEKDFKTKDLNKLNEDQFHDFLLRLEKGIEDTNKIREKQKQEEKEIEVPDVDPRLESLQSDKSEEDFSYDQITFDSSDLF